jgi:hypothetical protein
MKEISKFQIGFNSYGMQITGQVLCNPKPATGKLSAKKIIFRIELLRNYT